MAVHPFARSLAVLLVALLAAGPVAVAGAAEPVRVLVLPFRSMGGAPESSGAQLAEVLAEELRSQLGLQLAEPRRVAVPSPQSATKGAKAALARVERGEAMVKKLQFQAGAREIEEGLADWEAFPAQIEPRRVREALIQLSVARMRAGSDDAAAASLADAVRLAPEAPLSGSYPPVFRRAFDQARKKTLAGPRAHVEVKGEGQIELDGRDQGAAPMTLEAMLTGAHYLKVTRPDGSAWGLKLMVGEGGNAVSVPPGESSAPVLGPALKDLEPVAQNRLEPTTLAALGGPAKEVGAAFVVFGGVYRHESGLGVAAHLYSVKSGKVVALAPIHVDAELVSAGIHGHALAEEIAKRVQAFPTTGEAVPGVVASELVPAVKPNAEEKGERIDHSDRPVIVVVKAPERPAADEDVDLKLAPRLDAPKTIPAARPAAPAPGIEHHERPSYTWVWVAAGGVALAGAAVGGYLIYRSANSPTTGTATLTFQ